MGKKNFNSERDIVNLAEWLTVAEAVALRKEMRKPISKQRLRFLCINGGIKSRLIKDTWCIHKKAITEYEGVRGCPPGTKHKQTAKRERKAATRTKSKKDTGEDALKRISY